MSDNFEAIRIGVQNCFGHAGHLAEQEICAVSYELMRPFVLLKPALSSDGNQWGALYGENIQVGVAGFGDTPDAASRDFDKNWGTKKCGGTP